MKHRTSEQSNAASAGSATTDKMGDPPKIIVDGNEEWSAWHNGDDGGYKQDVEDEEDTNVKATNGPSVTDAQKEP